MAVPPYFVFPGKRMRPDLLNGATPGADGTEKRDWVVKFSSFQSLP